MTRGKVRGLPVAVAAGLLAACGSNEPTAPFAPTDPAGWLFAPDHIVEVAIEIDPADWDTLRRQTRSGWDVVAAENGACMAQPIVKPFTWFPASVTVDGIRRDNVAIRKKGYLGSLDEDRPALKVRFDAIDPDQTLYGLKRLTLNNAEQDPTWLRQCLAYRAFDQAGIPVPWCNFAHLTVNGRDLGLYVHLESVDRRWTRRQFERDEGGLWEGERSDFRQGWINTFEKKGDVEDDDQTMVDRSSLEEVANAASPNVPDEQVRGRLEKAIDFDEFLRFWATEKILEHWDGYSNNVNNFYVYRDPADDRFVFAPTGTDQITMVDPFDEVTPPVSVYAGAMLSNRLYAIPETRQLYAETLRALLDSAFHESELLAEIDRMQALITPVLARAGVDLDQQAEEVEALRAWISGRRAVLLADLRNGPPAWQQELGQAWCAELLGKVEGWFTTTFDTLAANPLWRVYSGTGDITGTFLGRALNIPSVGAAAGYSAGTVDPWPSAYLRGFSGAQDRYQVTIWVNPELFRSGAVGPFANNLANFAGGSMELRNSTTWQVIEWGRLVGGRLELDAASVEPGAPVSGRFEALVARWW